MPDRRNPRNYEDIVRSTVVEPDSSFRPTPRQVAESDESFQTARQLAQMTSEDRALYDRIARELATHRSHGELRFELERGAVTLSGRVRDVAAISLIEERVRSIDGVLSVSNRLVVA